MSERKKPAEILIAEDNASDVALIRRALLSNNIECVLRVIPDGAEVVQWIDSIDISPQHNSLDLVLLDMHLPKRDGRFVLQHLRSTAHYAQTPVIMMTAQASSVLEEESAKQKILTYFEKPSSLDEFLELGSIVRGILAEDGNPIRSQRTMGENTVGGIA